MTRLIPKEIELENKSSADQGGFAYVKRSTQDYPDSAVFLNFNKASL